MHRRQAVLDELRKKFSSYPNIPKEILDYAGKVVESDLKEPLLEALPEQGIDFTLDALNSLFEGACAVTGSTPSDLTRLSDFNPQDIGEGRLDAFFAQVRVINLLHEWGFNGVTPLQAGKTKRSDLIAKRHSLKYAVEVFCSSRHAYRWPGHRMRRHDLVRYVVDRAREKKEQLDGTSAEYECQRALLVLVLNSEPAKTLLDAVEYTEQVLQKAWEQLNWDDGYYVALMTGCVTSSSEGSMPDDVVYPSLD